MHIANLCAVQPRGLVGGDSRIDQHGLVACDGVEGQRRRNICHVHDLAERDQTKLYQCLEAVADTQHQTVTVFQKLVNSVLDAGLRKNAVMNLPLPSGSSPPLKPPGIMMICACFTMAANVVMESSMAAAERLRMIKV